MTLQLEVEPLTRSAFAAFGDVLETKRRQPIAINDGTALRFSDLSRIQLDSEGQASLSLFRAEPRTLPFSLRILERHPLGSQAFMPLSRCSFLVVVAPPGDHLDTSQIRAFETSGQQGICFHQGVWHHPLLAVREVTEFLVVDRAGPGSNLEERNISSLGLTVG